MRKQNVETKVIKKSTKRRFTGWLPERIPNNLKPPKQHCQLGGKLNKCQNNAY